MTKTFFIVLLFSATAVSCDPQSKTIMLPEGISMEQAMNEITTKKLNHELEFAFDIHKVLVQKSTKNILRTILNSDHKWQLLGILINPRLMAGLAGMVWQSLLNNMFWAPHNYKELTAEELLCIVRDRGNEQLLNLTMQIINTQHVDPEVKEIVLALKEQGYPLRIASNIGKEIYIKLKQQLEESQSNIFALFDQDEHGMEGKTIDYRVSPVQKPSLQFFQEFLDAYDPARKKLIIFIDDKAINVKAAIQLGFVGIHFKNAKQLKNDLTELGITI
ncbi:hypothetical protein BH09DEP1_BH09DEP1_0490 [soil metagenome]